MKKELEKWFSPLSKDELKRILGVFDQPYRENARKAGLLEEVISFIGDNPEAWLGKLTERDLIAIRDCVKAGPASLTILGQPDYPCIPLFLHLIDKDPGSDDMVFIPPCIHVLVCGVIDNVIASKEADGSFDRDRLILGVLNTYGAIPLERFIPLMRKCFPPKSAYDKINMMVESPILKMCMADTGNGEWLVSPYIFDLDGFISGMDHFKRFRSHKKFSEKDFRDAARNIPFCAAEPDSPEAQAVIRMYTSLGLHRHEAVEELHYIWLDCQNCFDENMTAHIFEGVEDLAHSIPTFEQYRNCLQTIADYANSLPKWYLKGRSADECDLMKITLRERESSEDIFQELAKEMHFGMAVPHVSPFEPCPCGSGLSYRNCHGKFMN